MQQSEIHFEYPNEFQSEFDQAAQSGNGCCVIHSNHGEGTGILKKELAGQKVTDRLKRNKQDKKQQARGNLI